MAETIEELVVKARPDGIDSTASEVGNLEGQLDASAESMGDTADNFGAMASKWQGAMTAIVGGLAVASAGLLSQVPVIGEAMGGLGSIISAVAYKMDGVLRPILQPVTNAFYDWSEAIYEADGAAGTAIGVIGSIVSILGVLAGVVGSVVAGFLALGGSWATVVSVAGTVASAATTVVTAIAGIVAGISAATAAVAIAVAAIIGFALAYISNFRGVRDKTNEFVGGIISDFQNLVSKGVEKAKALWSGVTNWFNSIKEDANSVFDGLIGDALDWGANLISNIVQGIKNAIPDLSSVLDQDIVAGVSISDAISTVDGVVSNAGSSNSTGGSRGFSAQRSTTAEVYLDGRSVSDSTGKYRSDRTSRRGRHG